MSDMEKWLNEQDRDFNPAKAGDDPIWLGGMKYVRADRIEGLEAKLAKAIYRMNDLLRNAKIVVDGVNNDDLCASEVRYAESSIIDCQILLAELTGGNDE